MPPAATARPAATLLSRVANYAGIEGLAKGANILLSLSLASVFPTSAYGVVAVFIAIELIVTEATLIGQNTFLLRIYGNSDADEFKARFAGATCMVYAMTALLIGAWAVLPFENWLSMGDGRFRSGILLLILGVGIQSHATLYLHYLRAAEQTRYYALIRVGSQALKFLLISALAYFFADPLVYPIGLALAALLIFVGLSLPGRRQGQGRMPYSPRPSGRNLARNIKFGLPVSAHGVAGATYTIIDRIQLSRLADTQSVAIYSFALVQGTSVFFLINVLSLVLLPKFYGSTILDPAGRRHLNLFLKTSVAGTVVLSLAIYFIVFPIALKFVPDEYSQGQQILPIVAGAMISQCVANYGVYKLTALNAVRGLPAITVASLSLNAALTAYLIPIHGIAGAAYAMLICETVYAAVLVTAGEFKSRKAGQ